MAGNRGDKSRLSGFARFVGRAEKAGSDAAAGVFPKMPSISLCFKIQLHDGGIPTGISDYPNLSPLEWLLALPNQP